MNSRFIRHRPTPIGARPPQNLRDAWVALLGLSTVFLFEMLDNSVLNVALPTISRELNSSAAALQWVTGTYSIVFGTLMLVFGALADRAGRRKVMLIGLVLLGTTSFATAFVTTTAQLIAVRAAMGVAAAMTTPGSNALVFRLFADDRLRVRAMTVVSTVGLVGLAVGPIAGGFVLAFAPWQALLLVNVPIAAVAFIAIRTGIPADSPGELHHEPIDAWGAVLGTAAIATALTAPTLFVQAGARSAMAWIALIAALFFTAAFLLRERSFSHPLLNLRIVAKPLVSSGLAFKAASNLAVAGMGYFVTLQLQLDWGWSPAQAALGMLPQVIVLIAGGAIIDVLVGKLGLSKAAWLSSSAVVAGLGMYSLLGRYGYGWIAAALVLVAAGMRVVGVVAGTNVMRGMPADRTTIGAALVDTAGEIAAAVGTAVSGTVLAILFAGQLADGSWSATQTTEFRCAVTVGGMLLTVFATGLVVFGIVRATSATAHTFSL